MKVSSLKSYYYLAKPGIVYGNLLTTAAGFLLASHMHLPIRLFIAAVGGTGLVIASACIFNNCLDRTIDSKMQRTRNRALVRGTIKLPQAIALGTVLGVVGFGLLVLEVNGLTALLGLIGYIDYLLAYGFSKRHSVHGTLVGSISGAMPITAGYTAVTGHLDLTAGLLFILLVIWQMPHFYAIAIYRRDEYANANLPVLSVARSVAVARRYILAYMMAFVLVLVCLAVHGPVGYSFLLVMGVVALYWLAVGLKGLKATDTEKWARHVFYVSLLVIVSLAITLPLGTVLP